MNDMRSEEYSKTEDEKEAELENFLRWYEENECQVMAYLNDSAGPFADDSRAIIQRRVYEIRSNLDWIRRYRKIEGVKSVFDHSKSLLEMSNEFVKELRERSPMHSSK